MKKGFSLIEILVYMSILTMVISVLISTIVLLAKTYRHVSASRNIETSALLSLDRFTQVLHKGQSVDLAQSTIASNPGRLMILGQEEGVQTTTEFYIEAGKLKMKINGEYEGDLTVSNVSVQSLIFRRFETPLSEAVRMELVLYPSDDSSKTETFYATAILKNAY